MLRRYEASHGARSVELAELLNSLGESELELADLHAAETSFGRAKEALLATEKPEEGAVASIDANQARAPPNEREHRVASGSDGMECRLVTVTLTATCHRITVTLTATCHRRVSSPSAASQRRRASSLSRL